ncbi:NTP transferase domain-containing protein [Alloiococcus sp. CFN-8]|uniref:NTP transferase domain-containing protein n=1 Tax=Alloiococcus sp. CFN-8 TaxID=3416081 RepID=UPI003CECBC27
MKISNVGGIIAAASTKLARPMLQVGAIPIIKRIVISFRQAGIFPIVIVIGHKEDEIKYQLSSYGAIFIHNEAYEEPPLFDSVKLGLSYLQDKCDKVIFSPVNVPMFSPDTLRRMLSVEGDIITPSYKNQGGHPVLLSSEVFQSIIEYSGDNGLRGAISAMKEKRVWLPVDDPGILYSVHNHQELKEHLEEHNKAILHPYLNITLEKESLFFNGRVKLLLFLIYYTKHVRNACDKMALSYSKAWDILNKLEKELGHAVVDRRHGGKHGGRTDLTEEGLQLLVAYQQFENTIFSHAHREFERIFLKKGVL